MTKPFAVVDLDGVLADVTARLHHIEGERKNWTAFFAGIPDDPPYAEGLAAARQLATDHELVYLSGRPERTRRYRRLVASAQCPDRAADPAPQPRPAAARIVKIAQLRKAGRRATGRGVRRRRPRRVPRCAGSRVRRLRSHLEPREPTLLDAQERLGKT